MYQVKASALLGVNIYRSVFCSTNFFEIRKTTLQFLLLFATISDIISVLMVFPSETSE